MDKHNGQGGLLVGLLVGAIAGIAVGMAVAPKTGAETRHLIRERVAQGVERVRRRGEHHEETEE